MTRTLVSLFDHSGNWSRPYRENGWTVHQIDIKLGIDLFTWDYAAIGKADVIRLLIAMPCTDYALSGAKHFQRKDNDGTTAASQQLLERVKTIIDYYESTGILASWTLENPMSRIHTLNPWLGSIALQFHPCDYAGYDPVPDNSRYNKRTWLWGKFNNPIVKHLAPLQKENPGWRSLGGKSERTKELRSITPLGFSYAFYEANH